MNIEDQKSESVPQQAHPLARVDAALMVVRTLVHAQLQQDPPAQQRAGAIARYCQLLATRMKLSPLEIHRLTLAAWLSFLDPASGTVTHFIHDLDLGPILNAPPNTDNPCAGILRVIQTYVQIHSLDPLTAKDLARCRRAIEEQRPEPASQPFIRRLMNILRDESFLDGIHVQAENILVVDPEEAVSPIIAPPLRNQGFEVAVCSDVPSARKRLAGFRPTIIIATKDMPLVDGLMFCQEVKSTPETAAIPFFVLCPKASKAAERQCLRVGANEVIFRPVDMELLCLKIQQLLRSRPAPAAAAETQPAAGFSGNLAEISFTDLIQIVCAGGRSLAIELHQGQSTGTVYVQEGSVIHATAGDLAGEPAFYSIMGWHEGTFSSRPCAYFPPRTITQSLMGMLMEGSRLQDERTPSCA